MTEVYMEQRHWSGAGMYVQEKQRNVEEWMYRWNKDESGEGRNLQVKQRQDRWRNVCTCEPKTRQVEEWHLWNWIVTLWAFICTSSAQTRVTSWKSCSCLNSRTALLRYVWCWFHFRQNCIARLYTRNWTRHLGTRLSGIYNFVIFKIKLLLVKWFHFSTFLGVSVVSMTSYLFIPL